MTHAPSIEATLGLLDGWTGVVPGIVHPGWPRIVQDLQRWKARAPFFLTNGIRAREEMLRRSDVDDERRSWYAFERELMLQVLNGQDPLPAVQANAEVSAHA